MFGYSYDNEALPLSIMLVCELSYHKIDCEIICFGCAEHVLEVKQTQGLGMNFFCKLGYVPCLVWSFVCLEVWLHTMLFSPFVNHVSSVFVQDLMMMTLNDRSNMWQSSDCYHYMYIHTYMNFNNKMSWCISNNLSLLSFLIWCITQSFLIGLWCLISCYHESKVVWCEAHYDYDILGLRQLYENKMVNIVPYTWSHT